MISLAIVACIIVVAILFSKWVYGDFDRKPKPKPPSQYRIAEQGGVYWLEYFCPLLEEYIPFTKTYKSREACVRVLDRMIEEERRESLPINYEDYP